MRKYQVVLIENDVLKAIKANLVESNDLISKKVTNRYGTEKTQSALTQAAILFNDGLKASNVSYYQSDFYFNDHKQKGLVIIEDSNYKAIEANLLAMVEAAKQSLSIVAPIEQAVTSANIFGSWVAVSIKPKTVFEAKTVEIMPTNGKTQVLEGKTIYSEIEYKRVNNLQRKSAEQSKALIQYDFIVNG